MKMSTFFVSLVLLSFYTIASSDEGSLPDSFKDFQKIELSNAVGGKGTAFIPKQVKYQKIVKSEDNSKYELIQFKIAKFNFEIGFGSGPSEGPEFSISATRDSKTYKTSIEAEKVFISDSGNLFAESRSGHYYNLRRKYIVVEKGIEEQRQPYYLIDLQCKVNEDLVLTSQRCAKGETIAVVPKGMTVRVLFAENYNDYYNEPCSEGKNFLVSTSFGLIGWACSSPGHIIYGPPPQLDCLRYDSP